MRTIGQRKGAPAQRVHVLLEHVKVHLAVSRESVEHHDGVLAAFAVEVVWRGSVDGQVTGEAAWENEIEQPSRVQCRRESRSRGNKSGGGQRSGRVFHFGGERWDRMKEKVEEVGLIERRAKVVGKTRKTKMTQSGKKI